MDVLNALYAAVAHLVENQLDKATVTHLIEDNGRIETLTITVRRTVIVAVELDKGEEEKET